MSLWQHGNPGYKRKYQAILEELFRKNIRRSGKQPIRRSAGKRPVRRSAENGLVRRSAEKQLPCQTKCRKAAWSDLKWENGLLETSGSAENGLVRPEAQENGLSVRSAGKRPVKQKCRKWPVKRSAENGQSLIMH